VRDTQIDGDLGDRRILGDAIQLDYIRVDLFEEFLRWWGRWGRGWCR
jgi:hypothetical protein